MSIKFDNVSVVKKANIYFDGKCVSHTIRFADGSHKTVGVIFSGVFTFNTSGPEIMETVAGSCRYRINGGEWRSCVTGQQFSVPANASFDVQITGEPYHYVCHL